MVDIKTYRFDHGVTLYNLGDIHRGNKAHDNKAFLSVIQAIHEDESARWVSTGDLCEVALEGTLGNVYESQTLKEELESLYVELMPILNKCLGIVSSNHHARFEKKTGMSLDELLCEKLNVPFLGDVAVINIVCGRCAYYVCLAHGNGGGRMRGGKAVNLERLADIYAGCDLYLEGHTHTYQSFCNLMKYVDKKRGLLSEYRAWFVTTGHFLQWENSYAARLKYRPYPVGAAWARLGANANGINQNKSIEVGFMAA